LVTGIVELLKGCFGITDGFVGQMIAGFGLNGEDRHGASLTSKR